MTIERRPHMTCLEHITSRHRRTCPAQSDQPRWLHRRGGALLVFSFATRCQVDDDFHIIGCRDRSRNKVSSPSPWTACVPCHSFDDDEGRRFLRPTSTATVSKWTGCPPPPLRVDGRRTYQQRQVLMHAFTSPSSRAQCAHPVVSAPSLPWTG
jgi:hypothetical protein